MSLRQQVLFWIGALLLFGLCLYVLADILLPFVAGLAIAYFLDPVADRLERLGLGRLAATVVILLVFALVFITFLVVMVPVLANQLSGLTVRVPEYLAQLEALITRVSDGRFAAWLGVEQGAIAGPVGDLAGKLASWVGNLATSIVSGGVALVSFLSLFVVTPVVAFYMLADWDRMIAVIDGWLPREHAPTIRSLAREIDMVVARFVRGQGTVCLLLGLFYAVALTLVGLNFGLLIGFGAGLISFIPYVGSTLGLLVSVAVALVQFWPDWLMLVAVVAIFLFGQFLEGYFFQPYLIGTKVGLHPVWLMFALFAFGYLFGFAGLLLAVPAAAAMGVLLRFALKRYMASPLYAGTGGSARKGGARRRK